MIDLSAVASLRWVIRDVWKSMQRNREIDRLVAGGDGLQPLASLDLPRFKRSDTLVVLGSGSSINRLDERALSFIRSNDSLGFNFWLLHDLVPTYYMVEVSPNQERNEVFFDCLNVYIPSRYGLINKWSVCSITMRI